MGVAPCLTPTGGLGRTKAMPAAFLAALGCCGTSESGPGVPCDTDMCREKDVQSLAPKLVRLRRRNALQLLLLLSLTAQDVFAKLPRKCMAQESYVRQPTSNNSRHFRVQLLLGPNKAASAGIIRVAFARKVFAVASL